MAMIEIDEEQVRRDSALRATVAKILANPKSKRLMEEAHKMVDPDAVTPTLEAEKALEAAVGATKAEIAELKTQMAKDKQDREDREKLAALDAKVEKGFAKLRGQGVTEEGIAGVRKLMEDEGIVNPEIAWAHFEKLHPPATPVAPSGQGGWNFLDQPNVEGDADLKKLIETKGESSGLVDKMAREALAEVRGQPRR